jgi:hypothetical protein
VQGPDARLVQGEFYGIDPSFIQNLSRRGGVRARQAPQG